VYIVGGHTHWAEVVEEEKQEVPEEKKEEPAEKNQPEGKAEESEQSEHPS